MARRKSHPQVEFEVGSPGGDSNATYHTADEALAAAAMAAISHGESVLDVLIWSEGGARWYGGDAAVEQYREDPDASVFERVEFKANLVGQVP